MPLPGPRLGLGPNATPQMPRFPLSAGLPHYRPLVQGLRGRTAIVLRPARPGIRAWPSSPSYMWHLSPGDHRRLLREALPASLKVPASLWLEVWGPEPRLLSCQRRGGICLTPPCRVGAGWSLGLPHSSPRSLGVQAQGGEALQWDQAPHLVLEREPRDLDTSPSRLSGGQGIPRSQLLRRN